MSPPSHLTPGTKQISLLLIVKGVLFDFLMPSFIFSHDANATYEYCCTELAALLAAVVEFGLVCFVCGLGYCSFSV